MPAIIRTVFTLMVLFRMVENGAPKMTIPDERVNADQHRSSSTIGNDRLTAIRGIGD